MARWTYPLDVAPATPLQFDEATNAVWFGGDDEALWSFRVLGQRSVRHGGGWAGVVAVVPAADGLRILVAMADGAIHWVSRAGADFGSAHLLTDLGTPITAAAALTDGRLAALAVDGTLSAVDARSGGVSPLASGLTHATHLAIDPAGEAVIAFAGPSPRISRVDLGTGDEVDAPLGMPQPAVGLTTYPGGGGALVVDAAGDLRAMRWAGTDGFVTQAAGATALARWHSLVFVAHETGMDLVEWGDDVSTLPIQARPDPLALSGWAPFTVDYSAVGLTVDDVAWQVAEGPLAGTISVARPVDEQRDHYEHRVLGGSGPAELTVEALDRNTGSTIATCRFRTVERWPDTEIGPPLAITGPRQVYAKWGGGSVGPENIRVHPAPETIRMAVVLLRTKGSTSTVDGVAHAQRFHQDVVGGGRSVKAYYEEVSARLSTASANPADPKGSSVTLLGGRVFGPIDLPWSWGELFVPGNQGVPWGSWDPMAGTWDLFGGTFSSHLVDLSAAEPGIDELVCGTADSVVFAVLPGTDDPYTVDDESWSAQWSWASASDAAMYSKTEVSTLFGRRPAIVMPAAFPRNHPAPWSPQEWVSTICHELAHNLGCPDLYNGGAYPPEVDVRTLGGWDLMALDAPLPHFSLAHKMRLGWLNPAWVQVCDFAKDPTSRSVTLQAIETVPRSGPSGGRRAGVEVRIRPGWNYYFEYRRKQPAPKIGDQAMPVVQAVFGTDVHQAAADDVARPLILQLPVDLDGDGPVLRTRGQDYEESDVTNPDRMNDFRLTRQASPILAGDPDSVTLQIDYVGAHRAELQIRPAPGRGDFKSPDIDLDGPAGKNVVVKGKTNTIRVRVRNAGTKAADQVNVKVQWLPFTTSAGPWTALPSPARQAIPPKQRRDFVVDWPLAASVTVEDKEVEHFCVRVDVDRYVDPLDPAGDEIVVHNNWAQSNFNTGTVAQGSPSERRGTAVAAHNVLPVPAVHRTVLEQTGDLFRVYVGASWRALGSGQSTTTTLDYESLAGDPVFGPDFERAFLAGGGERNATNVSVRGFLHPGQPIDGPIERFGVGLSVRAGLRTFIRDVEARGEAAIGVVSAGWHEDPQPVSGGQVRVVGWLADRPDEQFRRDSPVRADGEFVGLFPDEVMPSLGAGRVHVAVYYLGTAFFAPCHSEDLHVVSG